MSLQDFCFSVVYAWDACDVSNPLLKNIFWVLVWLKCIKRRHVLFAIDEDFHLIILVLLLLRTMEVYYMFMGELKFKKYPFYDYRGPCDILNCFLKK